VTLADLDQKTTFAWRCLAATALQYKNQCITGGYGCKENLGGSGTAAPPARQAKMPTLQLFNDGIFFQPPSGPAIQ